MNFKTELLVATEAVRKASLLARDIQFQVMGHKSSTIIKPDSSPVTIADYSCQAIIINAIKSNFPDDNIVGEESTNGLSENFLQQILKAIKHNNEYFEQSFSANKIDFHNDKFPLKSIEDLIRIIDFGGYQGGSKGRFWCLDPIDGTKGFLRGDQFSVCLALIVDGIVQIGVIGCPNLKLYDYGGNDISGYERAGYIFRAIKGFGSYISPTISDSWSAVSVNTISDPKNLISLEGVEKGHSAHNEQARIKEALGITKSYNLDSQVKYCLLSMGLGSLYLRLPIHLSYQEKIWDHAAGNIIVTESKGIVTDSINSVPLDFGNGKLLITQGIIASSALPSLHDKIVSISKKMIIEMH